MPNIAAILKSERPHSFPSELGWRDHQQDNSLRPKQPAAVANRGMNRVATASLPTGAAFAEKLHRFEAWARRQKSGAIWQREADRS